ncbi:MAG: 7-carboxy-7-deazaguanine synthase QueE [Candidatus Omnitrophica bacterium]|nr:7-carboxy-7-deazaguanine synthase QueE [Candidatus Omnitrophota bacterium]
MINDGLGVKGRISEIFESIQGEGVYQGIRQLFIRFYGCNLTCKFCDTRLKSYQEYDLDRLIKKINSFKGKYHSLCLTGGEPLLQVDFLKELLPKLKIRIYLETNGTLSKELNKVIDMIEIVSMDIKLPSSTGLKGLWNEHKKFLKSALKKEVFVKTVICSSTELRDLKEAVRLIKNFNKDIPFILQPNSFEIKRELIKKLIDFQEYSINYLSSVRIIPQINKFLKLR